MFQTEEEEDRMLSHKELIKQIQSRVQVQVK